MVPGNGRVSHALPVILLMLLLCIPALSLQAEEQDTVLARCGIRYPMGYDPNTVGEVQGQVQALSRPTSGPVSFQLASERERYIVLASPAWYWRDVGREIAEGATVMVRGSKTLGKDNNLYIIAQEIRNMSTGKVLILRATNGVPLWSGQGGQRAGFRGGFGSQMRGGGGPGGGMRGGPR